MSWICLWDLFYFFQSFCQNIYFHLNAHAGRGGLGSCLQFACCYLPCCWDLFGTHTKHHVQTKQINLGLITPQLLQFYSWIFKQFSYNWPSYPNTGLTLSSAWQYCISKYRVSINYYSNCHVCSFQFSTLNPNYGKSPD